MVNLNAPNRGPESWDSAFVIGLTIRGLLPAFIVFGLWHLWLAVVEFKPHCFYAKDSTELPDHALAGEWGENNSANPIEPCLTDFGINQHNWWRNLICAFIYVFIAVGLPRLY